MSHFGNIALASTSFRNFLSLSIYHFDLGGGARERIFWKNYFFHCAYTRYEAGLSIDEIWSEEDRSAAPSFQSPSVAVASTALDIEEVEETITFNDEEDDTATKKEKSDELFVTGVDSTAGTLQPTTLRSESDYEMVDDDGSRLIVDSFINNDECIDSPIEDGDYELDELEAEIARELED